MIITVNRVFEVWGSSFCIASKYYQKHAGIAVSFDEDLHISESTFQVDKKPNQKKISE